MIEQGLVLLIQAGLGNPPIAPGGWALQLPKDEIKIGDGAGNTIPMAWTWRAITSCPDYVLEGQTGYTELEIQIDCHGFTMAYAMQLARAIDGVLRGGWSGVLPDSDHTLVYGIQRKPAYVDGFNDANRSFVRSLEYEIQYSAP